jgi:4-carboxymuconolactone decarboxylase
MSRITPADLPADLPVKNNLVRATYNNPEMHRGFASLSGRVHSASSLPARTRELVVLQVTGMLGADYELQQHEAAARHTGVTDAEIAGLRSGDLSGLDPAERAAVEFARAVEDRAVDDAAWTAARRHYPEVALSDIAMLAAFYGLASRYVLAMAVDLEPAG